MDFKNLAENLIIVLISAVIGGGIGYIASTKANKQTIELLRPTIEEAIRKETTSITNEFKTEIKKLKTRNGETVIDTKPIIENRIKQTKDSLPNQTTQKKGFFKRLFGSKKDK